PPLGDRLAYDVGRAVRRAVVHDHQVEVVVLLRVQRLQRAQDAVLVRLVQRGHDDGESRAPGGGHHRTTIAPMLMPPASPSSSTTSPRRSRPDSRASTSCNGRVADAMLPWSATVTIVRSAGTPSARCTSPR